MALVEEVYSDKFSMELGVVVATLINLFRLGIRPEIIMCPIEKKRLKSQGRIQ